MAFGDMYGYRTNSRFVAAVAESDERTVPNPDYDGDGTEDPDANGEPLNLDPVVDLVLVGFANGRRNNVPVVAAADVETNQAVAAGAGVNEDEAPGETTGAVPGGGSGDVA